MKEEKKRKIFSKPWVQTVSGIIAIVLVLGGILIYKSRSSRVAIDMSVIEAPLIAIGPQSQGVLSVVYVKAGDIVTPGQSVAVVGSETLSAKIAGEVVAVQNTPGQVFAPGSAVVTMIDPQALRVVGTVDENKGLANIKVGDPVSFTVDAFGGQTFVGRVDEVSPTSNDTGAAFTISDKRPTRTFDVKALYDIAAYPILKNGMSAKMKVYIK